MDETKIAPGKENQENKETQGKELSNGAQKKIPFNPEVRHPLKFAWTMWYDAQLTSGKRPQTWGESMKQVYTFDTVEDFWRMYNNITAPSLLQVGCTYNMFKKGIEPKWEDPANANGGRWVITMSKSKEKLDRLWLWMVLACIGEVLEGDMDQVCGCVVNVRKQDKLAIWTRDARNEEAVLRIGKQLRIVLELPEGFPLDYESFPGKGKLDIKHKLLK